MYRAFLLDSIVGEHPMLFELLAAVDESARIRKVIVATSLLFAQSMEEFVNDHAWIGINNHCSSCYNFHEHLPGFVDGCM